MNNFEDKMENKLNKIKLHRISEDDKHDLWHRITVEKAKTRDNSQLGQLLIFNFSFLKMSIIAGLVLAVVLSTGGVVAASDNARPGDRLFGVDLALEKMQLKFADEEKKSELRLKFAAERQEEVKEIKEENEKNENKGSSISAEAKAKQHSDLNIAVSDLEVFIEEEIDATTDAELKAALEDIIVILQSDDDIEIKRAGNKIKIESKSENEGRTKIEIKDDSNDDDEDEDENDDDDDSDVRDNSGNDNLKIELDGALEIGQ